MDYLVPKSIETERLSLRQFLDENWEAYSCLLFW